MSARAYGTVILCLAAAVLAAAERAPPEEPPPPTDAGVWAEMAGWRPPEPLDDRRNATGGGPRACRRACAQSTGCAGYALLDGDCFIGARGMTLDSRTLTSGDIVFTGNGTDVIGTVICLPADTVGGVERLRIYPNMELIGFVEDVADAPTIERCIVECLNRDYCRSAMWYTENPNRLQRPEQNCLLNYKASYDQADMFIPEDEGISMYYIEPVKPSWWHPAPTPPRVLCPLLYR